MTRRGTRSWASLVRRREIALRRFRANANRDTAGLTRWEHHHGEMSTTLQACCLSCGMARDDVEAQPCNARHADSLREAEAIVLAVASYGSCSKCGSRAVYAECGAAYFWWRHEQHNRDLQKLATEARLMDAAFDGPVSRGVRRKVSDWSGIYVSTHVAARGKPSAA